MFFTVSRLPSQWIGTQALNVEQALEEGNGVDRTIFSTLIVLAVAILISRSFKWGEFLVRNAFLTAFLLFALVSVTWSDFPFIAFKRWFRDFGDYLIILIVLTDPSPLEAVRTFFRRLYYVMIPLSILLIRYYTQLGIHYSQWTGAPEYVGAATSKNTLGALCMLSGLFFFWDTVTRWPERKEGRTKRILLVNLLFIAMTIWLLEKSSSATSHVCLAIGCLVILAVRSDWGNRHSTTLKVLMPACFLIYLVLAFGFDLSGSMAGAVGRDPSLTGRTNIWHAVLSTNTNAFIGTGYESFWLGPRLNQVWFLAGHVTETHNGYLEVYLNLGIIGLLLLTGVLISCYKTLCKEMKTYSKLSSLIAALWMITLFYNMTEAGFKASYMCLTFLLGMAVAPRALAKFDIPVKQVPIGSPFPARSERTAT
jgi:O-antigen ligase